MNKGFIIVSQRLTHGVSTKTNNLGEGSWAIGQLRPIIQLNNIVVNKRHHLTKACAKPCSEVLELQQIGIDGDKSRLFDITIMI